MKPLTREDFEQLWETGFSLRGPSKDFFLEQMEAAKADRSLESHGGSHEEEPDLRSQTPAHEAGRVHAAGAGADVTSCAPGAGSKQMLPLVSEQPNSSVRPRGLRKGQAALPQARRGARRSRQAAVRGRKRGAGGARAGGEQRQRAAQRKAPHGPAAQAAAE